MSKRTMLRGKFVIGHDGTSHVVYEDGVVVYENDTILYVGHDFDGRVDETWDTGLSIISPGFIDLEADIDTDHANFDVVLFEKDPKPEKTWEPGSKYRTVDPYTDEEFAVRQKYSMAQMIMNGITTAMPIAGEQFHGWSQSFHEFEIMAQSAEEMGIRAYLGPSFKSSPDRGLPYDLEREEKSFHDAIRYYQKYDGTNGGMIKGFINPCQIAVTDPEILKRAKEFAVEVGAPMRLHAC
jgi:cytosine/adenosine deaminase-related metal-dependent hydrolase